MLGRIAYWSLVIGLWCFIGAIGVIGWVAAHLPPIQSLEVPKRPPSIQIVGLERPRARDARRDGRLRRAAARAAAIPAQGVSRHRGPPLLFASRHRSVRRRARGRRQRAASRRFARRLDHHATAREEPVPDAGAHHAAQAAGGDPQRLARAEIFQGRDPRSLSQPRLFRERRLRRRGRLAALFRQVRAQRDAVGSCAAGGPREIALELAPTRNFDGAERRAQIVLAAMSDAGYISAERPRPRSRSRPRS